MRRRANPLIDAKASVDENSSADKGTDDNYNDLDGIIVADELVF